VPSALAASFRDPSGFVFVHEGVVYRQIHHSYRQAYDHLMASGLYDQLVADGLLIPHTEDDPALAPAPDVYKVIRPLPLPFISYPFEWCFGQLQDAALALLRIQRRALRKGISLKDASAYNLQFHEGRPVLIDTLSFDLYQEGQPWVAYRQFCQHFLAPLALMSCVDVRLSQLLRVHIDGVPLDLAARLLPWRTRLRLPLLLHIHWHAASQRRYQTQGTSSPARARPVSRRALLGLLDSLEDAVRALRWNAQDAGWAAYYTDLHEYAPETLAHKRQVVADVLERVRPAVVWDLGANTGAFSRLASERGVLTIAFDSDPACVERAYREQQASGDPALLPLVLDLTNPTPGLGWAHRERMSLVERGPADLVLALALVHHLAIANNVPFSRIAAFLAEIARHLVIEFVPKEDPKVQKLLAGRADIFSDYSRSAFEGALGANFDILDVVPLNNSSRVLYWMKRRSW